MGLAEYILFVIGLILLGWYQKYQIKLLKKEIESQKEMIESQKHALDSVKTYADIFKPEQLKEWVGMREETVELQKRKEIETISSEVEKLREEKTQVEESMNEQLVKLDSQRKDLLSTIEKSDLKAEKLKIKHEVKLITLSQFSVQQALGCGHLTICTLLLRLLVLYSDWRVDVKLPDATPTIEIYKQIAKLVNEIGYFQDSARQVVHNLGDPSAEILIPEQMEQFDSKKFGEKTNELTVKLMASFTSYSKQSESHPNRKNSKGGA